MKIGRLTQLNSIKDDAISGFLKRIIDAVDGNLNLEDNVAGRLFKRVQFKSANVDVGLQHNLGRNLQYWIVLRADSYALFRSGRLAATDKVTYLQCNTAGTIADIFLIG
jgi:hypothetical protein